MDPHRNMSCIYTQPHVLWLSVIMMNGVYFSAHRGNTLDVRCVDAGVYMSLYVSVVYTVCVLLHW